MERASGASRKSSKAAKQTSAQNANPVQPTAGASEKLGREDFVQLLAGLIGDRKETFVAKDGWYALELGGVFDPTCREMATLLDEAGLNTVAPDGGRRLRVLQDKTFETSNAAQRLYYEPIRKHCQFEFFGLALKGSGSFKLEIFAQSDSVEQLIAVEDVELIDGEVYYSSKLEINTLIPNGSLVLKIHAETHVYLDRIRWQGFIREDLADTGDRVVAIRTFGNRPSVVSTLNAVIAELSHNQKSVLDRTLFIVYDATGDGSKVATFRSSNGARIVELKGPNYGGGGNASLLASLIIAASEEKPGAIAEVIIFDDDAHIDAETFVRHDSFIAGRKPNIISTSVIYSRTRPSVIQEFGGFWGRFFSPANHSLSLTKNDDSRLFFPYLIRSSRDVQDEWSRRYLGVSQEVEFSTFIFISFPMPLLKKIGAPLPFFLRNDDAEICLRAIQHGYKVLVNQNLFAWHDAAHNPIGEFYASLHGLILNCLYGGLDEDYFFRSYMERISKLAGVGNLPVLRAYEHALRLYSQGPGWMAPETIFEEYAAARSAIAEASSKKYCAQIPFELYDVLRVDQQLDVRDLVDPFPAPPKKGAKVVFADTKDGNFYSYQSSATEEQVKLSLKKLIGYLARISENSEALVAQWVAVFGKFDHDGFWRKMFAEKGAALEHFHIENVAAQERGPGRRVTGARLKTLAGERSGLQVTSSAKAAADTGDAATSAKSYTLPLDFDPQSYLRKNPDVMAAGFDPVQHWVKYGRHEGRQY